MLRNCGNFRTVRRFKRHDKRLSRNKTRNQISQSTCDENEELVEKITHQAVVQILSQHLFLPGYVKNLSG